jgi:lipopolysaccharide transport system ATP-binding protein
MTSTTSNLAISIRGLSKAYAIHHQSPRRQTFGEALVDRLRHPLGRGRSETFWALKDVAFDVHKGEVVGIIGRNGAGKSTLLKVLSRITEPSSGRVRLHGRVGSLLEVGTGFHPELTGRENIFLNGTILGMTRAEIRRRFDEIVAFAEVERFLDTPVKRYSSGMYVRLAFAVAAHLEPEILVVDEVLAVGDAEFQRKCLGKMRDVASGGRTVLFVSHNMGAVRALCDSCVLLERGQVATTGTVDAVLAAYFEAAADTAQVPLGDRPRRSGSGDVKVVDLTTRDDEGNPCSRYSFRQPITLAARAMRLSNSGSASLFFLVRDSSGSYVLSPFQTDVIRPVVVNAGESVSIEARLLDPGLLPGSYFVDVGVFDPSYHFHDWVEQAAMFEVCDHPAIHARLGSVAPAAAWRVVAGASEVSAAHA